MFDYPLMYFQALVGFSSSLIFIDQFWNFVVLCVMRDNNSFTSMILEFFAKLHQTHKNNNRFLPKLRFESWSASCFIVCVEVTL